MSLSRDLLSLLDRIAVLPRRMSIAAAGPRATVPMLRVVWQSALRGLDPAAYRTVFEGGAGAGEVVPLYVLRPAPIRPPAAPALEWILIGDAIRHDAVLWRAWDVASGIGIGPERRRFHVRASRILGPGGAPAPGVIQGGWPLGGARWPLAGDPAAVPCRIVFKSPLRILRGQAPNLHPNLPDLVVAASRRISLLLDPGGKDALRRILRRLFDYSRLRRSGLWVGRKVDLDTGPAKGGRRTGRQGVVGGLDLPDGPGELWPLFNAARWLHLGGGTVVGMGQPLIQPLKPA